MEIVTTAMAYAVTHMLQGFAATEVPTEGSTAGAVVWVAGEASLRGLFGLSAGGLGGLLTGAIFHAFKQRKYITARQAVLYPLVWPAFVAGRCVVNGQAQHRV